MHKLIHIIKWNLNVDDVVDLLRPRHRNLLTHLFIQRGKMQGLISTANMYAGYFGGNFISLKSEIIKDGFRFIQKNFVEQISKSKRKQS